MTLPNYYQIRQGHIKWQNHGPRALFNHRNRYPICDTNVAILAFSVWCQQIKWPQTHCGLVMAYGDMNLDKHSLGPEPMVTYIISIRSSDIHLREILQEILQSWITKISLKTNYIKFHSNLPRVDEVYSEHTRTKWLLGPLLLTWINFNPSMDK